MAPSTHVSLNSFVVGFILGCVLIYLVLLRQPQPCTGDDCTTRERTYLHEEEILSRETIFQSYSNNTISNTESETSAPLSACPKRPLHVVVLVLASPNGELRRNAIRGTWMHSYNTKQLKVTAKFLIGTLDLSPNKVASLKKEQKKLGDILLLDDLKDSYKNLSLKVLKGLKWVQSELQEFDFLVKTDDDSYVQLEAVSKAYADMGCPDDLYWGYFNGHGFPEENGKWSELNWHTCPHYLPYAMGGGYILSRGVVRLLAQLANRLVLYSNEDVTVGSWLAPFNLIRVHDMRFNVESLNHGCSNSYIITHKDSARDFHDKHKNLRFNGTLCSPEKEIRPSYLYNWLVSPLDCCNRTKGLAIQQSVFSSQSTFTRHVSN